MKRVRGTRTRTYDMGNGFAIDVVHSYIDKGFCLIFERDRQWGNHGSRWSFAERKGGLYDTVIISGKHG